MKQKVYRLLALATVIVLCLHETPYVALASPSSTKEKLEEAQKEKKETEQKIAETNDNLDDASAKQHSLKQELNGLNADLETIKDRLEDLENAILDKEAEIKETQDNLEEARNRETTQYEAMMKRIQFMYEDSETLYMDILFQARSFSELITLSNYVDDLARYDKKKFEEYQTIRIEIEDLEAKLQSDRVDLEVLKQEALKEKENVMTVINTTSKKVSQYGDMIDQYEKMLEEENELLKKQEEDIAALKKQYEEELRLSRLSANSVWRDISEVTFDEGDRFLLANLIYCEAGGEPYEGQVAVGSVVINRMLSPVYPATVSGVIYQKYQFSPVGSGRLAYALSVDKATASCYRAADEAMSGFSNVGTRVYFRTPIPGLEGLRIGNHIFY
ncbi:MAG: cell wall hydrolase [Lachnospiraceae bacterium]|nr:cell wall hydrolase [Lachnospiraceae bacterium]